MTKKTIGKALSPFSTNDYRTALMLGRSLWNMSAVEVYRFRLFLRFVFAFLLLECFLFHFQYSHTQFAVRKYKVAAWPINLVHCSCNVDFSICFYSFWANSRLLWWFESIQVTSKSFNHSLAFLSANSRKTHLQSATHTHTKQMVSMVLSVERRIRSTENTLVSIIIIMDGNMLIPHCLLFTNMYEKIYLFKFWNNLWMNHRNRTKTKRRRRKKCFQHSTMYWKL